MEYDSKERELTRLTGRGDRADRADNKTDMTRLGRLMQVGSYMWSGYGYGYRVEGSFR